MQAHWNFLYLQKSISKIKTLKFIVFVCCKDFKRIKLSLCTVQSLNPCIRKIGLHEQTVDNLQFESIARPGQSVGIVPLKWLEVVRLSRLIKQFRPVRRSDLFGTLWRQCALVEAFVWILKTLESLEMLNSLNPDFGIGILTLNSLSLSNEKSRLFKVDHFWIITKRLSETANK